jgi:betaine-aldehyde dehydrogenase
MQMRICGKEVSSADDRWMPVINPANGGEIDRVPEGTAFDVDVAVRAAETAFDKWSAKTTRERGLVLFRAADLVRKHYDELARLLTSEQGKPQRDAIDEVRGFANILEFYAEISGAMHGQYFALGHTGDCFITHEPYGVCGAIIPWNMPVIIMGWKVAPAILAGNTMVFKPASQTPLTSLRLVALMELAGLPPGVLNVVTGKGEIVGEAIIRHPGIPKISFTGNHDTGQRAMELAASQLKELHLELGGSDPMIVWKDADIQKAVEGAVRGRFYNAGQTCTAVKRLFVHQDIAGDFVSSLKTTVEALRVGDGTDPRVTMGPLTGKMQLDRIEDHIKELKENHQGTILSGGYRLTGDGWRDGFFYAPTLVTDPAPGCRLLQEEIFGPVLPILSFSDLDEAIAQANSTRYGLGASVWTNDLSVAKKVFSAVQAGIIWVNRHLTLPPEIPFGGIKSSGLGRENGLQAYHSYTRTKALFMNW